MIEKGLITGWLDELGVEYKDEEAPADDEFAWVLGIKGQPFRVLVAQRPTELNHLVMQLAIRVSENHRDVLRGLPENDRDRFIHDLKIHLLKTPVGHQLELEDDTLSLLSFGYNLFEDPLSMAGFFRRVHQLQSAALLAVQLLRKLERFREWE